MLRCRGAGRALIGRRKLRGGEREGDRERGTREKKKLNRKIYKRETNKNTKES